MRTFVVGQLRGRAARAGALALGLLAASAGFLLLASAGRTTDVRVQGSVESAFRPAYDVLVRPSGSRTPLERRERLVRPNYLSGGFGGITLGQYHRIRATPGVDVAAPIANIGYVLPSAFIPIVINAVLTRDVIQLYRVRLAWLANWGLSRYPSGRAWVYYNRRDLFSCCTTGFLEYLPGRSKPLSICHPFTQGQWGGTTVGATGLPSAYGPFDRLQREYISCHSTVTPDADDVRWDPEDVLKRGEVGVLQTMTFPIFVAAIDPVEEAKLVRVDDAMLSGRYLRAPDHPRTIPRLHARKVPAIVSSRPYVDESLQAIVERLEVPAPERVPFELASPTLHSFLRGLHGRAVKTQRTAGASLYEAILQRGKLWSPIYWTTSSVRYRSAGRDHLRPLTTSNPISIWKSNVYPDNDGFLPAPQSNQDVQFRRLHQHSGSPIVEGDVLNTPTLEIVGRYDPEKLPGFSPLSRVPLETYYPPLLEPGDQRTSRLLGGKPLLPTQNIGDYIQQPPLVLTTLKSIPAFTNPRFWSNVDPAFRRAPISAIRIRVQGVKGPDALSIARIKAVAVRIHDETGLDVDITAGSSPHPVLIDLPEGKFGRPELLLKEGWSKKGVSVSFLQALDKKRLGFLLLILATCCFVVANGAFASVRQRRAEIGTLLCLGWSPAQIFSALLLELLAIGLVAGIAGAALAAGLSLAFSLSLSIWQTLLVCPLALLLAFASGLLPAWRASRLVPLDAVRPAIAGRVEGRRVRHLAELALANLRRVPARSLVSTFGLAVGVAALMLIVAINASFQGTLVGTLLGSAISLEVSGLDYLSVALVVSLSALALADVLYLNLRERQAELVTLRTLGWADSHLRTLVALEAALLGLTGSALGVLTGLLVGIALGLPLLTLLLAALAASAGGVLVALLASLLPLSQIGRFRVPTVLAEE